MNAAVKGMSNISDDYMRAMLLTLKAYTVVILRVTPKRQEPGADKIAWEHGRRNFELRRDGIMPIICQVADESDVAGLCIFSTNEDETRKIMNEDPGVKSGIFVYETHPVRSFPGDSLPK